MVGAGQEQQGPERKTNRVQALQGRKIWVTHERQGPLRQSWWFLQGWGMPRNFKQSLTTGHRPLVVLQVIVEYVNLVIVNTTSPSFLHKEWSKNPL